MKKTILSTLIFSLTACSTPKLQSFDFAEWKPFGYDTLKAKVENLVGPRAANCGFVDRLSYEKADIKEANRQLARSQTCINQAMKNNLPFKFASVRIATTSLVWQIALLSPNEEFWTVTYDYAIDETGTQHFVKRCKGLDIDVRSAHFIGKDCVELSTEEWLAMPPVNPNPQE